MAGMRVMNPTILRAVLTSFALFSWGCADCTEDYDCPGTQICSTEGGECVPFVCRASNDCPPGNTCVENRCAESPARNAPEAGEPIVLQPKG